MSEYRMESQVNEVLSPVLNDRAEISGRVRLFSVAELVLGSLALVLTAFGTWVQVRIPGTERRRLSLVELAGGRLLLLTSAILLLLGLVVFVKFDRFGRTIQAVGVALFGWLAGFLTISISIVRGLLPNVSVAGVDLSDGLVGQGSGAVLAILTAIFLGFRLTAKPASDVRQRQEMVSPLNLLMMALTITLALSNHMPWFVAESNTISGRLEISGDALLGNFIVGMLTWLTVAMCAASMVSVSNATGRISAGLLIALSISKVIQVVVLWAGQGIVSWMVPEVVEGAVSASLRPAIYVTLGVALAAIPLSILHLARGLDDRVARVPMPNLPIAGALFIAALSFAIFDARTPSSKAIDEASATTTIKPAPDSSVVSTTTPDELIDPIYSVVYIQMTDGYDICWTGSGVIVGDGTRALTNAHVALTSSSDPPECNQLEVGITPSASEEPTEFYAAQVIEADEVNDLALLDLVGISPGRLQALEPEFSELKLGAEIKVLGYPAVGGSTITLTKGTVAGVVSYDGDSYYKVEVTINRGNSGGPMIDLAGNLVGIATAVTGNDVDCSGSDCRSFGSNLGLVRPIRFARALLEIP